MPSFRLSFFVQFFDMADRDGHADESQQRHDAQRQQAPDEVVVVVKVCLHLCQLESEQSIGGVWPDDGVVVDEEVGGHHHAHSPLSSEQLVSIEVKSKNQKYAQSSNQTSPTAEQKENH